MNKEIMIEMRKSLIKTTEKVGLKINEKNWSTWWIIEKIGTGTRGSHRNGKIQI